MTMYSRLWRLGAALRERLAHKRHSQRTSLCTGGGGGGGGCVGWHGRARGGGLAPGPHRAVQRRVCCSQVFRRLRDTGCSQGRPLWYGDGSGRARYGGYATLRRGTAQSCSHYAERDGVAVPHRGGGGGRGAVEA